MTYKLIIKAGAELDINEALEWYETKKIGLASELYTEIDIAIKRIEETPELFQIRYRNLRIVFTDRFPYGVHYTIEEDKIFVHAIMKMSKKSRE